MECTSTYRTTRVLIAVMTYPHPSRKYEELICTGGITNNGEWVRLYPIDYRYRPPDQRFQKYQWIEVELEERGHSGDKRKESRRPKLDTIKILGEPLKAGDWKDRRTIVDMLPIHTVNQLRELYLKDRTSLGIVKPTEIINLIVEEDKRDWKPQWQAELNQLHLFGKPKVLKKIPYKFSYLFKCGDDVKPRKAMIEDWELGVLFLRELDRLGSEKRAIDSVVSNYFDKMCSKDRDTHFFMGNIIPYNTWIVGGVYWPPKIHQPELQFL